MTTLEERLRALVHSDVLLVDDRYHDRDDLLAFARKAAQIGAEHEREACAKMLERLDLSVPCGEEAAALVRARGTR
jgi:hypothetical protein